MNNQQQIMILHLTDFHVKTRDSRAISLMPHVAPAISKLITGPTHVLALLSGDLAFSGTRAEYEVLAPEIDKLKEQLTNLNAASVHFAIVPGNHDCDLGTLTPTVLNALVGSIRDDEQAASTAAELAIDQAAFRSFSESWNGHVTPLTPLILLKQIDLGGTKTSIALLNTAWASTNPELIGHLRMPQSMLTDLPDKSPLSIVVGHHPLNWFVPDEGRYLSKWMDKNVDLAYWGHEHDLDSFAISRKKFGSNVHHTLGSAFDATGLVPGFNCQILDLAESVAHMYRYAWNNGHFETDTSTVETMRFGNKGKVHGQLRFSEQFEAFLSDPGAPFTPPHLTRDVALSDLFVQPEFKRFELGLDARTSDGLVPGQTLAEELRNSPKSIIFGAESSGKTSYIKNVIADFCETGTLAFYFDCSTLQSVNRSEISAWFNGQVDFQLAEDCTALAERLNPANRICILDNLQTIPGGAVGMRRVIERAEAFASRHVYLTTDSPAVAILSSEYDETDTERPYWKDASLFEIQAIGHRKRGELIRNWVTLGRADSVDEQKIETEMRQAKRLIDATIGRNIMPSYPFFVLLLLQQLEGQRQSQTAINNGSHGYIFDALITDALKKNLHDVSIGTVIDFLADFALELYEAKASSLTEAEFRACHARFRQKLVELDLESAVRSLLKAKVLLVNTRGFAFRYSYLYYYFLAKKLASDVASLKHQAALDDLVAYIHTERSANVLIFLAHLGHQNIVLDKILPAARQIYSDIAEVELSKYSPLFTRYRSAAQKQVLLEGRPRVVSDVTMHSQDSLRDTDTEVDQETVDDVFKFNTASKLMQVLGQILRSRAGSVTPEDKLLVARETLSLAKRVMGFIYEVIDEHADRFVHEASAVFQKALGANREQSISIANKFVGLLVLAVGFAVTYRASSAIGSGELTPLVDKLDETAVGDTEKLLLIAARLSGERQYSEAKIDAFQRSLKASDVLPLAILRQLVIRRFYLVPPDRSTRLRVCARLGIDIQRLAIAPPNPMP